MSSLRFSNGLVQNTNNNCTFNLHSTILLCALFQLVPTQKQLTKRHLKTRITSESFSSQTAAKSTNDRSDETASILKVIKSKTSKIHSTMRYKQTRYFRVLRVGYRVCGAKIYIHRACICVSHLPRRAASCMTDSPVNEPLIRPMRMHNRRSCFHAF